MSSEDIRSAQKSSLLRMLSTIRSRNPFHQSRLAHLPPADPAASLDDLLASLPFTSKQEIVDDQAACPPYGSNLTFPLSGYVRCHQTSGTTGRPILWLDTPESWDWMLANWNRVYQAAGVTGEDVVFFAFSFGPFLGFWTAFESASRILGALCLSGGGLGSEARLKRILEHKATVLCCTPTYAIHLAEIAQTQSMPFATANPVRRIIVAGEPGGSAPATRARIESLRPGSRVFDHHGMTEIGPVSYPCPAQPGTLHVIESSFIPEILDPATGQPTAEGECGELILTNLGRIGSPLIRYRTGDWVQRSRQGVCACGSSDLAMEQGIRGRTDDMIVVRGVNVYPSAVDEVVRNIPEVGEYQVVVHGDAALGEVTLRVEPVRGDLTEAVLSRLSRALQDAFLLRFQIESVAKGSLPRFEHKARRWRSV